MRVLFYIILYYSLGGRLLLAPTCDCDLSVLRARQVVALGRQRDGNVGHSLDVTQRPAILADNVTHVRIAHGESQCGVDLQQCALSTTTTTTTTTQPKKE